MFQRITKLSIMAYFSDQGYTIEPNSKVIK